MARGMSQEAAVKLEIEEGNHLQELPRVSSTGSGKERTSDRTESQSSPARLEEKALPRDDPIAHTAARSSELIKVEDISEVSLPLLRDIKCFQCRIPVDNNSSTAKSPSDAAPEIVTAHGSLEETQTSAGKEQTAGEVAHVTSTDQAFCESRKQWRLQLRIVEQGAFMATPWRGIPT
ncbi:hypothetical protein VP1G_08329 [Cytospora mali]|uniref:Uncharacterized protein n=1 Tax=Cytospora mali TaxID=578113 RepID=A0A194VBG0_CYTMA|nr:hypothetical protein VP1G_08329 [Valsa mali var. pyri (nom. inval.)]